MPSNTLIGALRAEATLESGKFVDGAKKLQLSAKKTEAQLKSSFGGMGASIKQFGASMVAGLSIGLLTQGIKAALDYAGSLGEISQQLGVTTKDLQVFRYAAGQVGVSQEELETGLSKLTITLGKVAAGAKEPVKALNAIGISVDQIKGKDTGQAFRIIADGLQRVSDRSQRAAVEVALFGKSGAKLDNLLAGGSTALNELADAAERLGIVLSDEQIQKADQTADKLEAVQTVLKAKIAGAVADNSDAIFGLADAFVSLTDAIGDFHSIVKSGGIAGILAVLNPAAAFGAIVGGNAAPKQLSNSVTIDLPSARPAARPISQFLGGGGRGRGRSSRSRRDTSARDAFQFEEDQRRAEMDILRAKQDLATDYVERTAISIQMLNLEKQGFEAELNYKVSQKELTQAQANILRAKNEQVDADKRAAILADEEAQRLEGYNYLEILDLELKRDQLSSQAQLAETAADQRDVRLRLLDLDYRIERARLEQVLADEKASFVAKEEARRRLAALDKTYSNDRNAVLQGTRGPMENYLASLPTTAAKAQEALEQLQVQGFEGLIDAALALSDGFGSAKDALLGTLKQFLLGLARMELQKLAGSIIPGLPGFALGGNTMGIAPGKIAGFVHGQEGILNPLGLRMLGVPNLDALNRGVPLSAVSNDNDMRASRSVGRGGDVYVNVNGVSDFDSFRRNDRQISRTTRRALGINQ